MLVIFIKPFEMRIIYLLILIAVSMISSLSAQQVPRSEVRKYKTYIGKPLKKLLHDYSAEILDKVYLDEPPTVLIGVVIRLKDNTLIKIYFRRLKHVTALNWQMNWNWDEVRKEKIGSIDVRKLSKE